MWDDIQATGCPGRQVGKGTWPAGSKARRGHGEQTASGRGHPCARVPGRSGFRGEMGRRDKGTIGTGVQDVGGRAGRRGPARPPPPWPGGEEAVPRGSGLGDDPMPGSSSNRTSAAGRGGGRRRLRWGCGQRPRRPLLVTLKNTPSCWHLARPCTTLS